MSRVGVCVAGVVIVCLSGGGGVQAGKVPAAVLVFPAEGNVVEASSDSSHSLRIKVSEYADQAVPSPDGRQLAVTMLGRRGQTLELQPARIGAPVWAVAASQLSLSRPAWSPDSRYFAFDLGGDDLYVADAKTRLLHRTSADAAITGYAWSPDSRTVAFGTVDGLLVCDVHSAKTRRLARIDRADEPSWTTDGAQIAYVDRRSRLAFARADGNGKPRTIGSSIDAFALSADGTRAAYTDGKRRLWVINLAIGAPRPARVSGDVDGFSWSPDSRRLAFSRQPAKQRSRIYLTDRDGHAARIVPPPHSYGDDDAPLFSPDSTRLAFEESSDYDTRLRVYDLRTGTISSVLPDDPDASGSGGLVWSPSVGPLPPTQVAKPLPAGGELDGHNPAYGLAADDGEVVTFGVLATYEDGDSWTQLQWAPASDGHAEPTLGCGFDVSSLVVAGGRIAYLCGLEDSAGVGDDVDVYLSGFGTTSDKPAFTVPCCNDELAGSGSLLVETVNGVLYRIEPDGEQTPIRRFTPATQVLAASRGRILLDEGDGILDVTDADGTILWQRALPHTGGAAFTGALVATLDNDTLTVLNIDSSQQLVRRKLPDFARLEALDEQTGVVAYSDGNRQHLLRPDGSDVPVTLPGQYGQAWATFTPDGSLYYAYNARWPTTTRLLHLNPGQLQQTFNG